MGNKKKVCGGGGIWSLVINSDGLTILIFITENVGLYLPNTFFY